jgi:hypothetical protein
MFVGDPFLPNYATSNNRVDYPLLKARFQGCTKIVYFGNGVFWKMVVRLLNGDSDKFRKTFTVSRLSRFRRH